MTKKILICGATGFIGRNMAEYYASKKDYETVAVYNKRPAFTFPGLTWVKADLTKESDVNRVLEGVDIIIQAAATTSGSKDIVTRPYIHVADNAVMNSLLLRAAFDNKVGHFIFFSCTVMYPSCNTPLKEQDFDASQPMHPRYFGVGNTKIYIERMCEFYAGISQTKFTVLRHSNIYGPHDKFDLERSHVLGATITKVLSAQDKGTIEVWGTGEEERDFLHVRDLTQCVDKAIKNQKESFALMNCGCGYPTSIKSLVEKVIELSGKELKIAHNLSAPTIKTNLHLNCDVIKNTIDWEPAIPLEEGLNETIKWWHSHINPATFQRKSDF